MCCRHWLLLRVNLADPYDLNITSLATDPVPVVALKTSQLHQKDHHVTIAQDANKNF